jgi:transposase
VDTSEQEHAPPRRRRFSIECKRRMVEESLHGPDSVSVVARRHDVNANQLFRWRRLYRLGELVEPSEGSALSLLPVRLAASESPPTQPGVKSVLPPGSLEIQLAGGHRLVVRGAADAAALRVALEVLGR